MTDFTDEQVQLQLAINQIVLEHLREQKRKRKWRWVGRSVAIIALLYGLYLLATVTEDGVMAHSKAHVGLIDIKGPIFENKSADADNFAKSLEDAYKNKELKALIIRIDSPGGSPVQADYMYNSLRYYRKKYPEIKTYSVCVDMCTSAAYYIAAAADEIYANPSSLVGSIGVLYNGFGFVDTLQKVGATRRLQTAGKNKGFLDPFSPVNPAHTQALQTMLDLVHKQFIDQVKAGRGSKLVIDADTFSGLFWTGIQAKERGLIDGFASSAQVARDVVKVKDIVDYTQKGTVLERIAGNMGSAMMNQLPKALGVQPAIL